MFEVVLLSFADFRDGLVGFVLLRDVLGDLNGSMEADLLRGMNYFLFYVLLGLLRWSDGLHLFRR